MRRALFLAVIGLGGAAILLALGVWQVQRLAEKRAYIAGIEARIGGDPVTLPDRPDADADNFLPVRTRGQFAEATPLRVLVSQKDAGAGYRLISPLETDTGRVMVDRGFLPMGQATPPAPQGEITVTGNLQWPRETDSFTPEADREGNIWFARDVPLMAEALQSRPLLVVARDIAPAEPAVDPLPVDTARIPDNHLQYAITWFSLAALWLAMTVLFFRRRRAASQS